MSLAKKPKTGEINKYIQPNNLTLSYDITH